jgi:anti-anti-sigma factor
LANETRDGRIDDGTTVEQMALWEAIMAFSSRLERSDGTALITLVGELDATSASLFKEEVERAATTQVDRLVLLMKDLTYIASAGLRVLIFAKQKMGAHVEIYIIGAQEQVVDTLQKTGFDRSCTMQDTYA